MAANPIGPHLAEPPVTGDIPADPELEEPAAEPRAEADYILFVPGAKGYTVVERTGRTPEVGITLELDGATYTVLKVGPSPFPAAGRCAYLA